MARITDTNDLAHLARELASQQHQSEQDLFSLLKAITNNQADFGEFAKLKIQELSVNAQQTLASFFANTLQSQLPANLVSMLQNNELPPQLLQQLLQTLIQAAADGQLSQLSKQMAGLLFENDQLLQADNAKWSQFLQENLATGGKTLSDAQTYDFLGFHMHLAAGPGLRSPHLLAKTLDDLSPEQALQWLQALVGGELAAMLEKNGIKNIGEFLLAGQTPDQRLQLAQILGLSRGELLALLLQAELLGIAPGMHGELGLNPALLDSLSKIGIMMLSTLASVRGLTQEQLQELFAHFREHFLLNQENERAVLKKDLLYWSREAKRRSSQVLLPDHNVKKNLSNQDAEELIQAWYLNSTFGQQPSLSTVEEIDGDESRREGQKHSSDSDEGSNEDPKDRQKQPTMQRDHERTDDLICFWIEDPNPVGFKMGTIRRSYVCINPKTGQIQPQRTEIVAPN